MLAEPSTARQISMASPSEANTARTLAASRYTGANSERRNSTSRIRVTTMIAIATRPRSPNTELIESAINAVWPATSNRTPDSPAARPSETSRSCSARMRLIAVASSGSVFSTTKNLAALPELACIGFSDATAPPGPDDARPGNQQRHRPRRGEPRRREPGPRGSLAREPRPPQPDRNPPEQKPAEHRHERRA